MINKDEYEMVIDLRKIYIKSLHLIQREIYLIQRNMFMS